MRPPGGDVGHTLRYAELLHRGQCVTPTRDRKGVRPGNCLGNTRGAASKRRELENADRPVPDNGASGGQRSA